MMPCTKKDLKAFYTLIHSVIDENLSLTEATELFHLIYDDEDVLRQLLEIDHQESAVLVDLAKHPTLSPLFFEFTQVYPALLFKIIMVDGLSRDEHFKRVMETLRAESNASSAPLDMIDSSHLNLIEPGVRFDERLFPFVNSSLLVDNAVLDAFLFKSFRNVLQQRGIALMPTIRSTEAIDIDQLLAIKSHQNIKYNIYIHVVDEELTPVVNEYNPIVFEEPIHFALWPVWISNLHYGLLILSMNFNTAVVSRGAYIEPFDEHTLFEHLDPLPDDSMAEVAGHSHQSIRNIVRDHILRNKVAPLVQNLGVDEEPFDVIFLGQERGTNYCSDYVIAAVARLASGEMNLSHDFKSIYNMNHGSLSEIMVQKIRMLEINMFGADYFRWQLPRGLSKDQMTNARSLILTHSQRRDARQNAVLGEERIEVPVPLAIEVVNETLEPFGIAGESTLFEDESHPVSPMPNRYSSFFSSKATSLASLDESLNVMERRGDANIIDTGGSILLAEDPFASVMMFGMTQ